ncbi:MAG: serine/threonine-protein kinase [Gemmataceae bacterium]
MPAPSTSDELLDLIRKSGVIDVPRLEAHIERLRQGGSLPGKPVDLARVLVSDGVLTHFQAEQFLQGKWRRFTIGKYRVLERLGAGGMGAVYLCEHTLMRRRVALKVLPESKASDSSSLNRFYREARAVAALDHPNIVRAYDIDCDDKLHFLVMEHVDGSSLQEIVKKTGYMDVLRAAHYVRQSALGLQHAHETARIVHRDIKPGNILVDRNGIVKILDMGLARFFHDEQDDITRKNDENVLGTADYLAPEQALDSHTADIRADIYSLGGTFYYCLTGRPPFSEGSVAQKLIWHQTRQPRSVRSYRPEIPEGISAILEKMMAKDPRERFQTPLELADALAPWTQTPIPPPPENEMPQFSLAARGMPSTIGEAGLSSSKSSMGETVPIPTSRKSWQLPGGATREPVSPPPLRSVSPPSPPTPVPLPSPATPQPVNRQVEAPVALSESVSTAVAPPLLLEPQAEEVEGDTPLANLDLGPRSSTTSSKRKKRSTPDKQQPDRPRRTFLYLVVAAVALVALSAVLIRSLFVSGENTTPESSGGTRPREAIYVKPGGSLLAILRTAKEGDRIVLTGDISEANVAIRLPNLTIEGEPGKAITWRCPPTAPDRSKLVIVQGAPGFTLRGITLDGADKTEALIVLYGKATGATLENLHLKDSQKFNILVTNCEGTREAPVTLANLTLETPAGRSAIHFDLQQHSMGTVKINRFFRLKDLKFAGPGQRITTGNLDFVELASIDKPQGLSIDRLP